MKLWMRLRPVAFASIRWLPIALVLLAFLVLKAYSLAVHTADEGIYFYGAVRVSEGAVPYRDFFFAHPPLHLLVPALLFLLRGGFSLVLAKSVAFVGAALQGLCAYLLVRRLGAGASSQRDGHAPSPRWTGETAGLLAAVALLFSESFLKASATATGINQTSGLLALATVLLASHRALAAGIATGAALMTLLQAAPVAAVLATAAAALGWRTARRFAAGATAVVVVAHVVFAALAGGAFFQQVYAYHLAKVDRPGEGARQLGFILVDNWALFSLAAVGVAALLQQRRVRLALLGAGAIVAQLVVMGTRPRVFPFYFQPAFFPAAVLAGLAAHQMLLALRPGLTPRARRPGLLLAGGTIVLLLLLPGPARTVLSPMRARQTAQYAQTYQWLDAPGLGSINAAVRAVFWRNGVREAGREYGAVTQYLWQRSRWLDTYPGMLARIVELKDMAGRQGQAAPAVFGDSTVTGMLAVEAGLHVAGDMVDTNIERFRSGVTPLSEVAELLARFPSAIVVLNPREGIGSMPEMQALIRGRYIRAGRYDSTTGIHHDIWVRPDAWRIPN